jgi:hypothetical protein
MASSIFPRYLCIVLSSLDQPPSIFPLCLCIVLLSWSGRQLSIAFNLLPQDDSASDAQQSCERHANNRGYRHKHVHSHLWILYKVNPLQTTWVLDCWSALLSGSVVAWSACKSAGASSPAWQSGRMVLRMSSIDVCDTQSLKAVFYKEIVGMVVSRIRTANHCVCFQLLKPLWSIL